MDTPGNFNKTLIRSKVILRNGRAEDRSLQGLPQDRAGRIHLDGIEKRYRLKVEIKPDGSAGWEDVRIFSDRGQELTDKVTF